MGQNELIIDKDHNRFELKVDSHTAFIDYKLAGNVIKLTHTEVPPALEGQGIGKKLVLLVFDYIKNHDLKLIPLCPFVSAYLKRHPEHQQLLAEGYDKKL